MRDIHLGLDFVRIVHQAIRFVNEFDFPQNKIRHDFCFFRDFFVAFGWLIRLESDPVESGRCDCCCSGKFNGNKLSEIFN